MDENGEISAEATQALSNASAQSNGQHVPIDEAIDLSGQNAQDKSGIALGTNPFLDGQIRTLDGDIAGDEFASDAINYQVLLRKIDALLERLKLDA